MPGRYNDVSNAAVLGVGGQVGASNSEDGGIEVSNSALPSRNGVDIPEHNRGICLSALQEIHIHDREGEVLNGLGSAGDSG